MKRHLHLILILSAIIVCCNSEQNIINEVAPEEAEFISDPCPDPWDFSKSTKEDGGLEAIVINDSVTQQVIFDKVWFEIISPEEIGNGISRSYLKFYRTDGTLEEEGYGIYHDHPVADFTYDGLWRFYSCDGSLKEIVEYENGEPKKN